MTTLSAPVGPAAPLAVQQLNSLPDSAVFSVKHAGIVLDASRSTIYRLFESGHLTRVKIGGSTRVRVSELRRLIGAAPEGTAA